MKKQHIFIFAATLVSLIAFCGISSSKLNAETADITTSATTTTQAPATTTTRDPYAGGYAKHNKLSVTYKKKAQATFIAKPTSDYLIPLYANDKGDITLSLSYPKLKGDLICYVYGDSGFNKMLHSFIADSNSTSKTQKITVGSKQTVYLYFTASSTYTSPTQVKLTASLTKASVHNVDNKKTLKSKTWTSKQTLSKGLKHYYKISVPKDSYFYVASNNKNISVCLLKSNKKTALSRTVYLLKYNSHKASFAVPKGTYYLRVTSSKKLNYQLYYKRSTVKNNAGSSLKKAKSISTNKEYIGILKANESTKSGRFYKIKLKANARLTAYFYVETCTDMFDIKFYDSAKNELPSNDYLTFNTQMRTIRSAAKIPKGTYYIKVKKGKKKASGRYSLRLRLKY